MNILVIAIFFMLSMAATVTSMSEPMDSCLLECRRTIGYFIASKKSITEYSKVCLRYRLPKALKIGCSKDLCDHLKRFAEEYEHTDENGIEVSRVIFYPILVLT
ncbi:hypothetical protein OESDEN_18355 [Oesophagostomum dentatum]|uniref:Saposin B-type domain-containing protein n=1 Tax=Oesophagostomum dentatum TaxID=61180 RepID=A0A0B1SFF4_OESDE|nr:hypothetical protein OESDEN_18355 [Oesophagostomum dentatum]